MLSPQPQRLLSSGSAFAAAVDSSQNDNQDHMNNHHRDIADISSVVVSCTNDDNHHSDHRSKTSLFVHRNKVSLTSVVTTTDHNNNDEHLLATSHASSSSSSCSCDERGVDNDNDNCHRQCSSTCHARKKNVVASAAEIITHGMRNVVVHQGAKYNQNDKRDEKNDPSSKLQQQQHQNPPASLLERFHRFRQSCGALLNNPRFQLIMVLLMIINALLMGVATLDFVTDSKSMSNIFNVVDQSFLVLFTIELALQIVYRGIYLVTDPWLLFDAVIILASWSFEKLQVLRCLRVLRSLRLIARIETLQAVVAALIDVGPKVTIILSLLILIMYIYAVLFTSLFYDMHERGLTDEDYFGDLGKTFLTLFQMVTLDWASVAWQVTEVYYYAWYIFISFIVITGLILYSLVVAVVCDAVAMQGDEEEKNEFRKMTIRIQELQQRVHEMSKQQEAFLKILQMHLHHHHHHGDDDEDLEIFFDSTEKLPSSPVFQKVIVSEHWVGNIVEKDAVVEDEQHRHHHHHSPHRVETVNVLKIAPVDPREKKI
jgi:hypothetical protein